MSAVGDGGESVGQRGLTVRSLLVGGASYWKVSGIRERQKMGALKE